MTEWLQRWHDRRRLWALMAGIAALIIALGSLTPGSEMPTNLPWDKANHFIGYGGLAGLIGLAGLRLPLVLVVGVLFGIVIEYLQIPVPGRTGGDWADVLANSLGVASAVILLWGFRYIVLRPGEDAE
jgi:VanZ family protein